MTDDRWQMADDRWQMVVIRSEVLDALTSSPSAFSTLPQLSALCLQHSAFSFLPSAFCLPSKKGFSMSNYKTIKQITQAAPPHMVGDGFKVRNFIGQSLWQDLSPFLMLDYNEPWDILPTAHPRGVDVHPHKGFETVTIVWSGMVSHEDSSGGKGTIGPGDVQWMTAGSGILHKEFHAEAFSKHGGAFTWRSCG
jgi:hypothetical protein